MSEAHKLILQIENYAKAHNMRPATVCRKVTGNPYFFDRLQRRADQDAVLFARIRAFMGIGGQEEGSNERYSSQPVEKTKFSDTTHPEAPSNADR